LGLVRTKKESQLCALTRWRGQTSGLVRTKKERWPERSARGALTYWIGKRLELVRTQKENEPVMGAHNLERAELGTGQDMKRKCGEAHLPTGRVDVKTGQDMEKRCASDRHSQSGGVRGQAGQD